MNDEMEKDRNGYPQDTVDAETGYSSGRGGAECGEEPGRGEAFGQEGSFEQAGAFEPSERSERPFEPRDPKGTFEPSDPKGTFEPLEPLEPSERSERTLDPSERSEQPSSSSLEERVKAECRRSCRRKFWTEVLKTVAKIAGVILAGFGLSSFDQED